MLNSFNGIGNLVRDIELRAAGESQVARGVLAINGFKDEVLYLEFEAWGKMAENLNLYTSKGSKLCLSGRLIQSSWEDKDGKKHTKTLLRVSELEFLSGKPTDPQADEPQAPTQQYQEADEPQAPMLDIDDEEPNLPF